MAKELLVHLDDESASIVDEAFLLDGRSKNIKTELEAAKHDVTVEAEKHRPEDGRSVRLKGKEGMALVSFSEEYNVNVRSGEFDLVAMATDRGLLDGVVTKKVKAFITPAMVPKVLEALKKAGIDTRQAVTLETSYDVDSSGYREFKETKTASPERTILAEALETSMVCKTKTRVTFSAIKK
jgi:hypothetical protein